MKKIRFWAMALVIALFALGLLSAMNSVVQASTDLRPLGFTPTEPKETKEPPQPTEPPATEPPEPTDLPEPTDPPVKPTRIKETAVEPPERATATPGRNPTGSGISPTLGPGTPGAGLPTGALSGLLTPAPLPTLPPVQVNGCTAGVRYMVKFVCGLQEQTSNGEPPVKPGNYATALNLHNYTEGTACAALRPALHYLPGETAPAPAKWQSLSLAPASDLEVDCNYLWKITGTKPGSFLKGMLDVALSQKLPLAAVYTAEITDRMGLTGTGAGLSIDVEYLTPFLP